MSRKNLAAAVATALWASLSIALSGAQDAGQPQYGTWGLDTTHLAPNTRPGDDFFAYANGSWLAQAEIPADKAAVTLRLAMSDLTEKRLHELLDEAAASAAHVPTTTNGKVGAFYRSFMNEARVEKLGGTPIASELAAVRAANSRAALAALMGRNNTDFMGSLYFLGLDVDLKDPRSYAVYVGQSGLGLPDRDYYLKPDFAAVKDKYQAYAARLLHLVNWPAADQRAAEIVALETRIAAASWTKVEDRDPNATYNPMSPAELAAFAPGFAWDAFFKSASLGSVKRVIVGEKSAFPKLAAIFAATPIDTLKAWQAFNITDNAALYLSKDFTGAYFEMRNRMLSGQQAEQARWKRAVRAVGGGDALAGDRADAFGNMQWAVGQIYTAKYFPPQAKLKIEELVGNLQAAYRARIEKLDWMGAETRQEALKKLDTYTIKVGYPDQPRDYSGLVIRDDDLAGNVRRAAANDWAFYVRRSTGPVDRAAWIMSPQTNDAYNGNLRDIAFPAGILQPPIFDPNADAAINYGAAGAIIGHELTHGFDDQGRKFDSEGKLRDWWSASDAALFEARAKILGAQYSALEPLPGVHINGDLTMGENIADLGGLTLALDAYRRSLDGQPAPVIDGVTGDQRVFLGWAQAWCGKLRDDAIRKQVVSDPHSPRKFRVNGIVRNIDAWYAAFDVQPGDKMYIPSAERVRIW